jgi:glycerol kinase
MPEKFIMALDQGTTSSRCILFDKAGNIRGLSSRPITQIYNRPGWVEHDPLEIWESQLQVAREALNATGVSASAIAAVGITNQRETTVVWDKASGRPIHNAIVWQCRRTAPLCDFLRQQGLEKMVRDKTGLILDPYFSGTKLSWILDEAPGARQRAKDGKLLFGTVDSWLLWKLTNGAVHATDHTNAARTLMFNIHTLEWDEDLLRMLDIPRGMLPEIKPSSGILGLTCPSMLGRELPIAGVVGDQQAALFGQLCWEAGVAKNTYGTGCFLLMNTGNRPVYSQRGLLTTLAASVEGEVQYALEGSVFIGGSVVQWLRDELGILSSAEESEPFAQSLPDNGAVYIVPAFVGMGAPYWNSNARGLIVGLTRGVNRCHLARAALESMAFQAMDILQSMEQDAGTALTALKVDGGACSNNFLMQFQSDILNKPVIRPAMVESTALGAAYLAGLAVGFWNDRQELRREKRNDTIFTPLMEEAQRAKLIRQWQAAVQTSLFWARIQEKSV